MKTTTVLCPWDFEKESTHSYTNAFHKYPAMLVPKVVDELLKEYSVTDGVFLDPFCGTGRSLVSAVVSGMQCFGLDINPLAVLISNVKLHPMDPAYLRRQLAAIILHFKRDAQSFHPSTVDLPDFFNREYWFSKESSLQIVQLMDAIGRTFRRNCRGKDFFYVVLSEMVRDISWTRKSEFKLYRMNRETMKNFSPDALKLFVAKSWRNIAGMSTFTKSIRNIQFSIMKGDAREITTDSNLRKEIPKSVDLVITSPPYGDSRTTVDYGNFSRLSLQWLRTDYKFAQKWGFLHQNQIFGINNKCLGGRIVEKIHELPSPTLTKTLKNIRSCDAKRSKMVESFYADFYLSYREIVKVLSKTGHVCFVVANRRVKGIEIPMDRIVVEFGDSLGLKHVKSVTRKIFGKKLPRRINTNSNNLKHTNTMLHEHIEVLRKM